MTDVPQRGRSTEPGRPGGALLVPTLIFGLYLAATGACGLLLMVGVRVFGLSAGWTGTSTSAAVAAGALGVAVGSILVGVRANRTPAPAAVLAVLQAGCGLSAILAVAQFRITREAYLLLWPLVGGGPAASWALRFLLALSLFFLPAAMISGMPLILARLMGGRQGSRLCLGFALGLTLAGVAIGLAVAGSALVPGLGLRGTLLMGVALAGVACAGTVLVRQRGYEGPGVMGAALLEGGAPACDAPASTAPGIDPAASGVVAGGTLAAAVVLFGFTGWAYLATWGRTLAFFLGGTFESRAITGAVFLMGMALGAFLAAGVADRLGRPLIALVVLLALSSVVAYASMHLAPMALMVYMRFAPLLHRPALAYLPPLLTAASLMLPTCLLLGAALPFLPLAVKSRRRPVAGTLPLLAAGVAAAEVTLRLAVVPAFGLRRALALAAAVGLLSAILFIGAAPFKVPARRTTVALALLGLMVVLGGRPAPWVPHLIASGPYRYADLGVARHGSADAFLRARRDAEAVFYREGRDASITVEMTLHRSPGLPPVESLALRLDGSVLATTGDDLRARVLLAQIPVLIHGPTERVLLIGLVDGVTAGSVLRHPVKSVTIIEPEPALFEAAVAFADYNHRPLDDQRVQLVSDAARARLLVDHAAYDIILLDAVEPWRPEGAALLTSEGLSLLRSRLRQGGVVGLRIPLSAAPEPAVRSMLSTFALAFKQVLLFQVSGDDLIVVGSPDPLSLDVGWMRNVIGSSSHVAQDLRRVTVLGPNEILMAFRLGRDAMRRALGEGAVNDDSRGAVEFASARQMMVQANERLAGLIDGAWEGIVPFLKNYGKLPQEKAESLYSLAKSYLGIAGDPKRARGIAQELMGLGRPAMARWVTGESLFQEADIDGALAEWQAVLEIDPSNLDALFSLGTYYLDSRDYWKADGYLERAGRVHADTPVVRYHYGRNLFYLGRHREAIRELRAARQRSDQPDTYPLVDYLVGVAAHRLGREAEAAESLQSYLKWAYGQNALTRLEVDAHLKLAEVYDRQGKRFDAHKERQKGEELRQKIQTHSSARQRPAGPAGGEGAPDAAANGGSPEAPATGRGPVPGVPATGGATPAPAQP